MPDVGCGDGTHLASFGPGSLGLAGEAEVLTSDPSRTYQVIRYPFEQDVGGVLRASNEPLQYPFILCMKTLEHVLTPHQHLLMLRHVIEDDATSAGKRIRASYRPRGGDASLPREWLDP